MFIGIYTPEYINESIARCEAVIANKEYSEDSGTNYAYAYGALKAVLESLAHVIKLNIDEE